MNAIIGAATMPISSTKLSTNADYFAMGTSARHRHGSLARFEALISSLNTTIELHIAYRPPHIYFFYFTSSY